MAGISLRRLIATSRALTTPHNFADFLANRKAGQPFCFWYGGTEPHREYEEGVGRRSGKDPRAVKLPSYYPDSDLIRNDMLDLAVEVEWFDTHLGRMIALLEQAGELDDTIIVVTSDHGMPFPRVKGQIYEHGVHLPCAVRWGSRAGNGRVVDDFINVRDLAPTFLEAAGVAIPASVTGRSFLDVLVSGKSGRVDTTRDRVLLGKERHDLGRPLDQGYPVRAIRTAECKQAHEEEAWDRLTCDQALLRIGGGPDPLFWASLCWESHDACNWSVGTVCDGPRRCDGSSASDCRRL